MEIISSLIPLFIIISIVVSIVSKAKQAQTKSAKKGPAAQNTQAKSSSLQEIIRRQIEEQRNAVSGTSQSTAPPPKPERVDFSGGQYARPNASADRKYSEGDALNRKTLEGTPVEMQRHSHDVHIGGSYNEGDALNRSTLEGSSIFEYEDKFDLDEASKVSKRSKKTTSAQKQALSKSEFRSLEINRNSVVNGIIMSEILGRRGGRRAAR